MFLEDVYVTGIVAAHCPDIKRIASSSFLMGQRHTENQFKPDFDAVIHHVVDLFKPWYKRVLQHRKEKKRRAGQSTEAEETRLIEIEGGGKASSP